MPCYCEICGREVADEGQCRTVFLDNAVVKVCPQCYQRLLKQGKVKVVEERRTRPKPRRVEEKKWVRTSVPKRMLETMYEIVEDYSERIRRARQRHGWSQAVLAHKVHVSENVIKRIEAGRLKPGIELARRLEKVLGIVLLEPIVEEESGYSTGEGEYLTIGDLIRVGEDKE